MVSWSTKRKTLYGGGVVLVLAIIFAISFFGFFYQAPSCTDGKQNGDETGVDCGGSCTNICESDSLAPVVYWAKAFNISGNVYNIAAYVENPNVNSENLKATYEFKVFDDRNILLGARDGETFIPKNKKFIVFEPGFIIPNRVPKYVEFTFTSFSTWQKDDSVEPDISVAYSPLAGTSTAPRITGTISNNSFQDVGGVELVALVQDSNENAVAVSRTFVDSLPQQSLQDFVFTWQKPFDLSTEPCLPVPQESQATSTPDQTSSTTSGSLASTTSLATSTDLSQPAPSVCVKKPSVVNIIYRILPVQS